MVTKPDNPSATGGTATHGGVGCSGDTGRERESGGTGEVHTLTLDTAEKTARSEEACLRRKHPRRSSDCSGGKMDGGGDFGRLASISAVEE